MDKKTSYEVIFSRMPNISKVREFGCSALFHLVTERRSLKLTKKAPPSIMLGFENGIYQIWDINWSILVESKHESFNKTELASLRDYENDIYPAEKASKPSIDIDTDQVSDVESSQTENSHDFEDRNGCDNNTLTVKDNEGEKEQACWYLQREKTKSDRHSYITRNGTVYTVLYSILNGVTKYIPRPPLDV